MNIKKLILLGAMTAVSLSSVAFADYALTCDANEHAQAHTQVQQAYKSEMSQFEKKISGH